MPKAKLISPYGGKKLVNLVASGKEREELLARAAKLPSHQDHHAQPVRLGIARHRRVFSAGKLHGQSGL